MSRGRYKRPFDIAVLAAAFALLLPLWLLLAAAIPLAIRLEDSGPIFYRQTRLGLRGKPFRLVKFRTMVVDAEAATGPVWAGRRDPRITRVGGVLRRLRFDELPQLWSVLRGEMSLVGPRPERPALAERFAREIPGFGRRLRVRPGIVGLAQAAAGYHAPPRRKLRYDNLYIATMSPWLDLRLLVWCVVATIRKEIVGDEARAPADPHAATTPPARPPSAPRVAAGPQTAERPDPLRDPLPSLLPSPLPDLLPNPPQSPLPPRR